MGKIIAGGVIVVAVVGFFLWQKGSNDSAGVAENMKQSMEVVEEKSGVVSSIKDAMGLGKKMQCTYSLESGGESVESTVMVNGDRYQSTTVTENGMIYGLFDGETQYVWTSTTKTGLKTDKTCMQELKNAVKDLPETSAALIMPKVGDAEVAFNMAKNVSCTPFTGVELSVPKDVTFTDQCVLAKQSLETMKQMQDKMPQGMTAPAMPQY